MDPRTKLKACITADTLRRSDDSSYGKYCYKLNVYKIAWQGGEGIKIIVHTVSGVRLRKGDDCISNNCMKMYIHLFNLYFYFHEEATVAFKL